MDAMVPVMVDRLTLTERLDWLQLARSSGIGPEMFYRLLHSFGSARQAYDELSRLTWEAGGRERPRCKREEVDAELDALQAMGCYPVTHGEIDYPAHLAQIDGPPPC